MNRINGQNITELIKYLYQKRLQQQADENVISSWSNLSDTEAQMHLQQLFTSWGYSPEQMEAEINAFENSKINGATTSPVVTTTTKVTPSNATHQSSSNYKAPLTSPKKKSLAWVWILIVPLLAAGGYLLYKFQQFKSLNYLYVTTDNVAIRNSEGELMGKMDIFADKNSVSFLRTPDQNTYPIKVKDNVYQCRRVLFDSTTFQEFLMNKPETFGYVNENYVIDDKENFIVYRNVFKAINNNKHENADLTSAYRKVIVGSLRQQPSMEQLYLQVPCTNYDKSSEALLKIKQGDNYQVVALLSDGKYYIFTGNPSTESYSAPKPLLLKKQSENNFVPLDNARVLFKNVNGTYFLNDCFGTPLDYYTHLDENKLIDYIKYSFDA